MLSDGLINRVTERKTNARAGIFQTSGTGFSQKRLLDATVLENLFPEKYY